MFLLYPILYYILQRFRITSISIISIIYIFNLWNGIPCFQIQTLYFFSLGIYLRMYNIDLLKQIGHYKTLIINLSIISFILRYLSGNRIFMPTFIMTFSCITIYTISKLKQKDFFKRIQSMKKYSFFIFAVHIIIVERLWGILYHPFFSRLELIHCLSYIINPIFILIICLVLYNLLEKICPRILSMITGSRTKTIIRD